MKIRKDGIIRVIGIIMFIFSCCASKYVVTDDIINSLDLIVIFTFIGGLYLMFKKS